MKCIECKDRPAHHWGSVLCFECLAEILNDKLKEGLDDKRMAEPDA